MASSTEVVKDNGATGLVAAGKVVLVPISQIHADDSWNIRCEGWKEGHTPDDTTGDMGLDGLVKSIMRDGQDTPIDLRENRSRKQGEPPYEIVDGFRRFEAIARIHAVKGSKIPNVPTGMILAVDHGKMSDKEARRLSLRRGVQRENISMQDTAFGIWELVKVHGMSQEEVGELVGKSQGYVSKLHGVMKHCSPDVTNAWRHAQKIDGSGGPVVLSLEQMDDIAKLPRDKQPAAYDNAFVGKASAKKGPAAWLDRTAKKTEHYAHVLGALVRVEALPEIGKARAKWGDILHGLESCKAIRLSGKTAKGKEREITEAQFDKLIDRALKAYEGAKVMTDAEQEDADDGDE